MKQLLIGLGVVVLIVTGAVLLLGNKDEPVTESPTGNQNQETTETQNQTDDPQTEGDTDDENAATVTYTDDGFTPASITVGLGDQVTFINQSSMSMQVASDDHPVHDDLPGFDSLRGIEPGQSYTFTFETTGTWGYHNHLVPNDTGEVVVTQ